MRRFTAAFCLLLAGVIGTSSCTRKDGTNQALNLSEIPTQIGDLPMLVIPAGKETRDLADSDSPAWNGAAEVVLAGSGAADKPIETRARIFCTASNLYVLWHCREPEISGLMTKSQDIWNRDSVELFIEPRESLVKRPYHHVTIDAAGGATFERYHIYPRYFQLKAFSEKWEPAAEVRVSRHQDSWTCALKLPLAKLHLEDEARQGGLWRINFCRTRPGRNVKVRGEDMHWSWSPLKGPFHSPARFGYAVPAVLAKATTARRTAALDPIAPRDASVNSATNPETAKQIDALLANYWDKPGSLKDIQALAYRGEAIYELVTKKVNAAVAERTHYAAARDLLYQLDRDRPDLDPPADEVLRKIARFEPHAVKQDDLTLAYRVFTPRMQAGKKYPLTIFLHGSAERGGDNRRQLFGGAFEYAAEDLQAKYPCFVLAPQCPLAGGGWADMRSNPESPAVARATSNYRLAEKPGPVTELLFKAIDETLEKNPAIDRSQIYLAGSSMGGFGTWELVMRRPTFFAAAVVLCGGGDETKAGVVKDLPIWDFHGALDVNVKPEASRNMKAAMEKIGGKAKFTEFPDRGHALGQPNFDPEVLEWMFAQKRQ